MKRKGAREAAGAPQGENGAGEQVQTTLEGVEPDTAEEVVWVAARSEGYNQTKASAGIRPTFLILR